MSDDKVFEAKAVGGMETRKGFSSPEKPPG